MPAGFKSTVITSRLSNQALSFTQELAKNMRNPEQLIYHIDAWFQKKRKTIICMAFTKYRWFHIDVGIWGFPSVKAPNWNSATLKSNKMDAEICRMETALFMYWYLYMGREEIFFLWLNDEGMDKASHRPNFEEHTFFMLFTF